MSTRSNTTGLTGPIIIAMLGALLVIMALRVSPVLWLLLVVGVAFLALAVLLLLRQGRRRHEPQFAPGSGGGSAARADSPEFTITLRGYEMAGVDNLVARAQDALTRPAARRMAVREEIMSARPKVAMRGYTVTEVDTYLRGMADRLAEPAP